jgi:hypothetical protein
MIPIIGLVCTGCFKILQRPTMLEGEFSVEPLQSIAVATQIEFRDRTERLRLTAQQVVLAARAATAREAS